MVGTKPLELPCRGYEVHLADRALPRFLFIDVPVHRTGVARHEKAVDHGAIADRAVVGPGGLFVVVNRTKPHVEGLTLDLLGRSRKRENENHNPHHNALILP